jgi:hypothetical protein
MAFYDLEHVVPRAQIISVRRSQAFLKSSVIVTFQDMNGAEHTLSLYPRRQAEFLRSLGGEISTTEAEPGAAPDTGRM